MDKNQRRKVKKFWRDKVFFTVGVISSLCVLPLAAINSFQIYRQNPVPQRILDVQPKLDSLFESLDAPDKSPAEKIIVNKEIEKIAKENKLGVTRTLSWAMSHSMQLEQALSTKKDLSPAELEQLLKSLEIALWRNLSYSLQQNSTSQQEASWILSWILSQDLERYFVWDLERYLERYFVRYLERDLERYFVWDLERYFVRDFVRYFERYFEQIRHIKLCLLKLERGQNPEIEIEQLSQQIYHRLARAYQTELLKSYNLDVERESESFTASQKQAKLIQFALLASVSAIGLLVFSLLFMKQRNQDITWNMTGQYFLPEEYFAELETKYERLKSEGKSPKEIRSEMLREIKDLLFNLYIKVPLENMFLPSKNKRD